MNTLLGFVWCGGCIIGGVWMYEFHHSSGWYLVLGILLCSSWKFKD